MVQANKLFRKKYKLEALCTFYDEIVKSNTASGIDKMRKSSFDKLKEEQLEIIDRKVLSGTYRYAYYKEKLILKSRNSLPRMISIPTLRDRVVLKLLHEILMETFDVKMELVQTVISRLLEQSKLYSAYIKIDMENFFGSIDHEILMKKIQGKIRKEEIKKLIIDAIKNPTVNQSYLKDIVVEENKCGIPQGIPIANVLAEIFLKKLDSSYKQRVNLAYFRYVDDIIILCNEVDVLEIKREIIRELKEDYNLKINEEKTKDGSLKEGINFLGYFVKQENNLIKCTVKRESILKVENTIINLFSKYKNTEGEMSPKEFAFYLNLKITGAIIQNKNTGKNSKYGWLFFYSQINDIRLLYHLDYLVSKCIDKYKMKEQLRSIEIKSYVKSYYEITQRRSKTKYIFRPDEEDILFKRNLLIYTFGIDEGQLYNEKEINSYYYKKVQKKILELEKDIQNIS